MKRTSASTQPAEETPFMALCAHRHSVRAFDTTRPVPRSLISTLITAAQTAPSAGNMQAWRVRACSATAVPAALRQRAYPHGSWVLTAPWLLVFTALRGVSASRYHSRGRKLYAVQDATLAASLAMMRAQEAGLATCWLGAFDKEAVEEMAGVGNGSGGEKEEEEAIAVVAVGYEASRDGAKEELRPRKRRKPDDVVWVTGDVEDE